MSHLKIYFRSKYTHVCLIFLFFMNKVVEWGDFNFNTNGHDSKWHVEATRTHLENYSDYNNSQFIVFVCQIISQKKVVLHQIRFLVLLGKVEPTFIDNMRVTHILLQIMFHFFYYFEKYKQIDKKILKIIISFKKIFLKQMQAINFSIFFG